MLKNYKVLDLCHKHSKLQSGIEQHQLDLFDTDNIFSFLVSLKPDVVLHSAAITHIDNCEKDKVKGKDGLVWKINVDATREIVKYCYEYGKKLILLSSECVFNDSTDKQTEFASTSPMNWYGFTKATAEELVQSKLNSAVIVRGVVAYNTKRSNKKNMFGFFKSMLQNRLTVKAVSNQLLTPTYIEDIWLAIETILKNDLNGVYHVTPSSFISPYDFSAKIAAHFKYDQSLISKVKIEELLGEGRASLRLRKACLDSSWSQDKLGLHFRTLEEVLSES